MKRKNRRTVQRPGKKKPYNKRLCTIGLTAAVILVVFWLFRDQAGPILEELKQTSPQVIFLVVLASVCYTCIDGWNFASLARHYNPAFSNFQGIVCAFFSSFYRTLTIGSGSAAATAYYMKQYGIDVGNGISISTVSYVFHKMVIGCYSLLLVLLYPGFLRKYYAGYIQYLSAGYALIFAVAAVLLLVCISPGFHRILLSVLGRLLKKDKWRPKIAVLEQELTVLRTGTKELLGNKKAVAAVVLRDFLRDTCWYLIPWMILRESTGIGPLESVYVTSLVTALAGVIPMPAGIGSTEVVYTLLFGAVAGEVKAASSMLIYRFSTYFVPFIIGGLAVISYRGKKYFHRKENGVIL